MSSGVPSLPSGSTWVFTQPQFLLLNVAVGGGWPGNPDGTAIFPQRMTVDYVRVYAPTILPACGDSVLTNPGFEMGGLANWTTSGAGGNTLLQNSNTAPVHGGSNVFKVYGQFTGAENYSGVFSDVTTSAGQVFTADGWLLTPGGDTIAGGNTAWIEVSFRDASTTVLSLYRTALVNASTPAGVWLNLAVTTQLNPGNSAVTGSVTNLVSPPNASFVRYQVVFRQPAFAGGAVLFDDLKLRAAGRAEFPVQVSTARVGNSLNLGWATYLDLPYQILWKASLTDPRWQVLTDIMGDGAIRTVTVDLQSASRFYRVLRLCN